MVFAKLDSKGEETSPLTNLNINVMDRQALKLLEDSVTDLQLILLNLLSTITGIRSECYECCRIHCSSQEENCDCDRALRQFDEYIKEIENYVQRAVILRDKAKSTAQLLSDLLNYENAVALKVIAHESHEENRLMIHLTGRSTKDAATVKVLTIIGLVYLPTSIVTNFFSTQFVQTNDSGHLHVSPNVWFLAAIAIPLTIVTIATWWLWAHCEFTSLLKITHQLKLLRLWYKSTASLLPSQEKERLGDLESGTISRRSTDCQYRMSPRTLCDSGSPTWSTTVSSGKK